MNLTLEQMRVKAPAIFAENPYVGVSEKYNFVKTIKVIEDLEPLGWVVHDVMQQGLRKAERDGFQKHLVTLRRADQAGRKLELDELVPELLVDNSHDATSALHFNAAINRCWCANQCTVAESVFPGASIRHIGYDSGQLEKVITDFAKGLPKILDVVAEYQTIELTRINQLDFAASAMELRWGDKMPRLKPADFLIAKRKEDQGNDLWRVFNRVQEHIFKGGVRGRSINGKRRYTNRKIKAVDAFVGLNKKLWELAETYRAN